MRRDGELGTAAIILAFAVSLLLWLGLITAFWLVYRLVRWIV